ncbi:MAG TPA: YkgJ family cysteine cluster protein [Vicinamibacterales bacterium]|nr:YkgJ family cysteine cluster protein [Vicinamibacterales bacterium]
MLVPPDQRFTCGQCGRCCRRATVPVTRAEAEAYRREGAARWFSEPGDPFEPVPGRASLLQIRHRADGGCGFLSDSGLCRIHEELGFDRKPLACRVFPLRFHPIEGDVVVTTSFACPTIIANDGDLLPAQSREIGRLYVAWKEAQPESPRRVELVAGHALAPAMVQTLRSTLSRILDIPGPDGSFDVALSVRRIAAFVEDLSRRQVLRLSADDFSQYVDVMSRHVLNPERVPPTRMPSTLTRLLFRGFLLAVASVQSHLDPEIRHRPNAIRARLVRLALHLHGFGPAAAGFDLPAARQVTLDVADDEIREIATHYLRSVVTTLGTGRRPIVDELSMAVAYLNAACVLARMQSARLNYRTVDAESFTQGLLQSADPAQADDGSMFSRLLTTLSGGVESFYLFPASTI